jgi:hypothetical protein
LTFDLLTFTDNIDCEDNSAIHPDVIGFFNKTALYSMKAPRQKSEEIRHFILDKIADYPTDIVKITAKKFALSRQAIARHLKKLILQGDIEIEGNTSGRVYSHSKGRMVEFTYAIADRPEEHTAWKEDILPLLQFLPDTLIQLWNFCFEKIFNNAVNHSEGKTIQVKAIRQNILTTVIISDDGKGLFRNIKEKMGLDDDQHAALELSKGRLTNDQDAPGLDIFYSSKMTDHFTIISGKIVFTHQDGIAWDWAFDLSDENIDGTIISISIKNDASRTKTQIFKEFPKTEIDARFFSKTCIPIKFIQYNPEALFSRSQARRILARIDRFSIAVLDFLGVEKIGPAFADQIFRVFASEHPEIQLLHCNTNKQVETVIRAVKNHPATIF